MHHHRRLVTVLALTLSILTPACDRDSQTVQITAQDFRFTPREIRLRSIQPIELTMVNEGREVHEFETPLLAHQALRILPPGWPIDQPQPGTLRLPPNRRLSLSFLAPPGTYLFHCRIRGHAGMIGMILVE
jgi:uncharacterized cupredoxin-like copper-binding protein